MSQDIGNIQAKKRRDKYMDKLIAQNHSFSQQQRQVASHQGSTGTRHRVASHSSLLGYEEELLDRKATAESKGQKKL